MGAHWNASTKQVRGFLQFDSVRVGFLYPSKALYVFVCSFLRLAPFDNIAVWKQMIGSGSMPY